MSDSETSPSSQHCKQSHSPPPPPPPPTTLPIPTRTIQIPRLDSVHVCPLLSSSPNWPNSYACIPSSESVSPAEEKPSSDSIINSSNFRQNLGGSDNKEDSEDEELFSALEVKGFAAPCIRTKTPCSPFQEEQSDPDTQSDFNSNIFQGLQTRDSFARKLSFETIKDLFSQNSFLFTIHIHSIVRLSCECPFPDVAAAFCSLKEDVLEMYGGKSSIPTFRGPSSFIPKEFCVSVTQPPSTVAKLFEDIFINNGRVSHVYQVLAWHPTYLHRLYPTLDTLLTKSGPLPLHWRNYIAILAASRFHCHYLVALQTRSFLVNHGDPSWLITVENAPIKIQKLLPIIATLAHLPWLIKQEDIRQLVTGKDNAWSTSELVSAIVLACTFFSLSGIIYGCGILPELDLDATTNTDSTSTDDDEIDISLFSAETKKVAAILNESRDTEDDDQEQHFVNAAGAEEAVVAIKLQDFDHFRGGLEIYHVDFDVKAPNYSIFHAEEYSWQEHGYELMNIFYSEAAPLLDDLFNHIFSLTYNSFSTDLNPVDTMRFRQAVWQYVQRIHGIFHDDYDYREINIYLNIPLKTFIKKVCCNPETINRRDFYNLGYDLRPEEKCHICMLATESRKQAALLYGLRAVMQHHTGNKI